MKEIKAANPDRRGELKEKYLNIRKEPEDKYETHYAAAEGPKVAEPDRRGELEEKYLNIRKEPEDKYKTHYAAAEGPKVAEPDIIIDQGGVDR